MYYVVFSHRIKYQDGTYSRQVPVIRFCQDGNEIMRFNSEYIDKIGKMYHDLGIYFEDNETKIEFYKRDFLSNLEAITYASRLTIKSVNSTDFYHYCLNR